MNILFVCNEYPPTLHGGIGTFVYTLTHKLIQFGHNCQVVAIDPAVSISSSKNEEGVKVTRLKSPYGKFGNFRLGKYSLPVDSILNRIFLSSQVNELIAKEGFDIIESYDWSGPLWKKPGRPLIVRMHGSNSANQFFEGKHVSRYLSYFEKKNLLMADQLVAVTHHIGKITTKSLGVENRTYQVIYNGVNTDLFRACSDRSENTILYAGTVNRRKGVSELFKAFKMISRSKSETRLLIAGKLLPGENGENQKKELLGLLDPGIQSKVEFLGQVPYGKMPEIYSQATLAIFPSHAEAFGLTCAEAMACETPVLMTNKASGPELVEDGVSGLLIDSSSPEDIARMTIFLIDHNAIRKEIGKNGRLQVLSKFDQQEIVKKNIGLYQGML